MLKLEFELSRSQYKELSSTSSQNQLEADRAQAQVGVELEQG